MSDYKGKTAVVTGGASGIGRALCEELARRGAIVTIADINPDAAEAAAAAIRETGGKASAARLDVSNAEEVQALIQSVHAGHGRLDYMFNNAGIGIAAEMRDISLDTWQRIINVNLMGALHGTTAAYAVMAKQGFGHIINTASLAGLMGFPTSAPYSVTKHGIVALSISLRFEAEAYGVKVSTVCPGYVQTAFYDTSTVINADRRRLFGTLPAMMSPAEAARRILRGVDRNQAFIVFPFSARLFWRLYRLCPALLNPLGRKFVKTFRESRG